MGECISIHDKDIDTHTEKEREREREREREGMGWREGSCLALKSLEKGFHLVWRRNSINCIGLSSFQPLFKRLVDWLK